MLEHGVTTRREWTSTHRSVIKWIYMYT
jgi:hypothetical protein